ncbi:prenyl transferase-like [Gossypium arboreum]|uniref:prenyl transferase-like n=1 Tax=Gossypium arboreum TaxID=29729 RepID=UPI0008193AA3|nr:prenyl transferase-like [Gossypium arboreum]
MVKLEPIKQIMTDREKHNDAGFKAQFQTHGCDGFTLLQGSTTMSKAKQIKSGFDQRQDSRTNLFESFSDGQMGEDEIEIDINTLSHETLYKLRKLLDNYLLEKQKNQAKAESCEIKIASYPPVAIEKGLTHRNIKCCSSSGSSGESGSSSSVSTKGATIFSGADRSQMYEYGKNLGLSFQVVDDILDFTQSAEQLGKPASSDLAKGNLTAPIIFALEKEPKLRDMIEFEFCETGSLDKAIELVK